MAQEDPGAGEQALLLQREQFVAEVQVAVHPVVADQRRDEIGAVAVGGHGGGLRLDRGQGTSFHWPLFICTMTTPRWSEP
ncbi:hypothetical protein D9M69_657640 [compost metagenome]